ncbi:dipeptidyl aminopeptidase/acylaminoacyl peptidase [Motilibacter rhizosphaerae]|uniref:Dipeptidyl aminopeptidase/acylaminoacyl peptidase n=1 Tax=Motilibacter rhizosphaerae TaxID=598652 RepID=A0A4Q7NAR7_9ACTN|nr:S9 family peptidase [Motilibacter rhizosphaerae]RZS79955.1 dipeptidyl aminopeptidase/acylaminoacyl peptidase [Motilibacter rhizosphaerae]
MTTTLPYGAWPSPLSAEQVARAGTRLGEIALDQDGRRLWWSEGRPDEGGRTALVRAALGPDGGVGSTEELLPRDFNARTRVHEYGGGSWAPAGDGVVAARWDDQRLWLVPAPGVEPRPLTPDSGGEVRYADLTVVGDAVVCVQEDVSGGDVRRALVSVPLAGGPVVELHSGPRFLSTPRLSPDGTTLAWLSWEHPRMPWDGTELWTGTVTGGGLEGVRRIAGGAEESLVQPGWTHDGALLVVSDRSGWWRLCAVDGPEGAEPVLRPLLPDGPEEHAFPQWVFGQASYQPLDDGRVALVHGSDAYALDLLDPATGELVPLDLPWTAYRTVVASGGTLATVAGSPTAPHAVVTVDVATGGSHVARLSLDSAPDPAWLPVPRSVVVPSAHGRETHAHLYPPTSPDAVGPEGERPPWVLFVHGGPTAQSLAVYSPEVAYFTSRGIGVADVNYGGSTGYGRAYRQLLQGAWGIVDVEDCVAVARWLGESGHADPSRVAIRGGSAGGFTVLACLTGTDAFGAGASYYGVADLRALAEDTHDFESRYLDGLVGPLPEAAATYAERAPLSHVDGLSCPVLLLQGDEDRIVPPEQAEAFAEALRRKGLPHALVVFAGEQHGFRKAESIVRALESELSFYGQALGFDPPGVPELPLTR